MCVRERGRERSRRSAPPREDVLGVVWNMNARTGVGSKRASKRAGSHLEEDAQVDVVALFLGLLGGLPHQVALPGLLLH